MLQVVITDLQQNFDEKEKVNEAPWSSIKPWTIISPPSEHLSSGGRKCSLDQSTEDVHSWEQTTPTIIRIWLKLGVMRGVCPAYSTSSSSHSVSDHLRDVISSHYSNSCRFVQTAGSYLDLNGGLITPSLSICKLIRWSELDLLLIESQICMKWSEQPDWTVVRFLSRSWSDRLILMGDSRVQPNKCSDSSSSSRVIHQFIINYYRQSAHHCCLTSNCGPPEVLQH